jgi:transcription elongation regulator 1
MTDPRFNNSPLPLNRRVHLFHAHISHLREKQTSNLCGLFEAHAQSLSTAFDALPLDSILSSAPVTKLGYDTEQLEQAFDRWQRERAAAARVAFDEMMSENSFVEFWGRLGKIDGESINNGLQIDGDDIGEGGDAGEKVDMKALAKTVDMREMEKVLKVCLVHFFISHPRFIPS